MDLKINKKQASALPRNRKMKKKKKLNFALKKLNSQNS